MSEDSEKFSGGCLCGDIRYELVGEPGRISVCHCRMCQRMSGAPYLPAAEYSSDRVAWEKQPEFYRSSGHARRSFCSRCGSSIAFHFDEGGIWISVGTLDHPESFEPDFHIFIGSRMPWSKYDESLPQYDKDWPA